MDKIALVTGSTNNVGKGIAEILSKDGFLVIVTSRHGNEAKEVAENLPNKGVYYQVDFSDAQEIAGLFSELLSNVVEIPSSIPFVSFSHLPAQASFLAGAFRL